MLRNKSKESSGKEESLLRLARKKDARVCKRHREKNMKWDIEWELQKVKEKAYLQKALQMRTIGLKSLLKRSILRKLY